MTETRYVLITRHPADCAELRELVRGCSISIKPYPVLRLEDVVDEEGWQALLAALPGPSQVPPNAWLVLASPRAVKRFLDQVRSRQALHLLRLPVAAVGESTAAAGAKADLEVAMVGPGSGLGLAKQLIPRLAPTSPMVLACGQNRRHELPDALAAAGHTLHAVVVYRMRATPPRELPPLGRRVDTVVLTSPRAAKLYLQGVGGLPLPCSHLALGPTTRDAAAALGIECGIPEKPTIESLAEELCQNL